LELSLFLDEELSPPELFEFEPLESELFDSELLDSDPELELESEPLPDDAAAPSFEPDSEPPVESGLTPLAPLRP
jgi:hypothetical protein